jgi:hypothetical protein
LTNSLRGIAFLVLLWAATAIGLTACSHEAPPSATAMSQGAPPDASATQPGDDAAAAALAAKERELADREAILKQQELEQELARRDAENAAALAAQPRKPGTPKSVVKPAVPVKAGSNAAAASTPPPPPPPVTVPAGTGLVLELVSVLNTKKALVGDPVQARVANDLVVNGQRAIPAGSTVSGSVTKVVSGTSTVGGTPTLVVRFDRLAVAGGPTIPISAKLSQKGTSDTGKDTAKIIGGTAAGAIIGHQVDDDHGSVVGGALGGVAGAVAAKKTGGDIKLPAGTVVNVAVEAPFEVPGA